MSAPLLDVDIDDKHYGARQVLRKVHLQLRRGEQVCLVGASGCGKSSLLTIVAGLDRQFRGQVSIDGCPQGGVSADIGVVFQEPRLFPWLTVAQNIAFGEGGKASANARVLALLDEVGMSGYADALPKQLSGGQAQRVAIARGLFTQPRVLLLDEPFSAVDAFTRMKLQDLLASVVRQHALTLLLVTHDIDEAIYLADRIVLLGAGGSVRAQYDIDLARPRRRDALPALKIAILAELEAAHLV